jgi:hypothetical protein
VVLVALTVSRKSDLKCVKFERHYTLQNPNFRNPTFITPATNGLVVSSYVQRAACPPPRPNLMSDVGFDEKLW